jgi:hypothetical protein
VYFLAEVQIKVTLDYQCRDGHNCSKPDTTEHGPPVAKINRLEWETTVADQGGELPLQVERTVTEQGEVSQSPAGRELESQSPEGQEQPSKSTLEEILETFKARVDPEDFLQYLVRFQEEDEVRNTLCMYCRVFSKAKIKET